MIGWAHSESLGLSLANHHQFDRAMAIRRGEYDYLLPTKISEPLTLATWLTCRDGKLMMRRRFQLIRNSDGMTVLRGRWDLVCIEIASGRPRRMPREFSEIYLPAVVKQPIDVSRPQHGSGGLNAYEAHAKEQSTHKARTGKDSR